LIFFKSNRLVTRDVEGELAISRKIALLGKGTYDFISAIEGVMPQLAALRNQLT